VPEPPERGAEPEPNLAFLPLKGPREGGPEVVVLRVQPCHPEILPGPDQLRFGLFGKGEEEVSVPDPHLVSLPALLQLQPGVLADRLQHPVARHASGGCPYHHERLVYQPAEEVEDIAVLDAFPGADCLGSLKRPASREHREPVEQVSLRIGEQRVAPVERTP
jgi:hypothetical protein